MSPLLRDILEILISPLVYNVYQNIIFTPSFDLGSDVSSGSLIISHRGDIRSSSQPNYPCPGAPTSEFHTTGESDVTGCAMAIAPKSNARDVRPEDFVIFSINHKCVWTRFTKFPVGFTLLLTQFISLIFLV